ncbi:MAG: phytoene desaturase [Planctomycetota bacterium]|nr:MAG: phytoene desaturase [Planctomycetota bacterium]
MKMEADVVVVGAGLGGLAAASTLAARGYQVTVVERNAWLGGKSAVLEDRGYRFDMGPTILTLPSVLRRVFSEAGRSLDDYLELIRLDPQWRCFFADNTQFDLVESVPEMAARLRTFSGSTRTAAGYEKFHQVSKQLDEVSNRFFFWKSVGGIADTMDLKGSLSLGVLRDVLSLRFGRTVSGLVRSYIPDQRIAQMIDHFTQYVGSSPEASPAVLCGIAHMQTNEGIWYPRGGIRAVPEALTRLGKEQDIRYLTGRMVRSIDSAGGRVSGVTLDDGQTIKAAAVVSNSDCVRTRDELLPAATRAGFLSRRKVEAACSGVVLYLGLRQKYDKLLHHNFVFSRDPHAEFQQIYSEGEPAEDPTCYVCAPSMSDDTVAPGEGESLYVLVHTPYLRKHHNWRTMLPGYRDVIIEKLKKTAGLEDIEDRIEVEHALTPEDIDRRYHVLKGAIYGLASHGRFFGAFKPANRVRELTGLYLAGGSAHPGPGMPMVVMSGWIAADAVDQDLRGGPTQDAHDESRLTASQGAHQ